MTALNLADIPTDIACIIHEEKTKQKNNLHYS